MKTLLFLNVTVLLGVGAMLWFENNQLANWNKELSQTRTTLVSFTSFQESQEKRLRELRTDILRLRNDLTTAETTPADLVGTSMEGQLHRLGDIDQHMAQTKAGDTKMFAAMLGEIDEWTFHPDDQDAATAKIEMLVAELRKELGAAIDEQTKLAVSAASGAQAKDCLSRAGELFSLFPQPKSEAEKQEVLRLSNSIAQTNNRIGELSRMRYNLWVTNNVQSALSGFYSKKKTFGDDSAPLIDNFISNLGTTDPSFLDPAVTGLYQHVLSITNNALKEANRVELAKKLNSTDIQHKSPLDF